MNKYFSLLIIILLSVACKPTIVNVVEETFNDGSTKMIMEYEISYGDSIPIHRVDYHLDGSKRMEGYFLDGKRDGEWLSWHENGKIWSKGYFKEGERTGKSWIYYKSGKPYMKGSYSNGKKTGQWLVFDEEGIVIGDQTF